MTANLYGVWAKYERGVEQLAALNKEVIAFGKEPHPFTITVHEHPERGQYVFRFDPAWPHRKQRRWGAIIGEIVHDLRSALDQLVTQLVRLNGGVPDREHSFPVCCPEPSQAFAEWAFRERTDRRKRRYHGPLFGVSDDALALIESCQPYQGGDWTRLGQLHDMWNTDKHRTLIPTMLMFEAPALQLADGLQAGRRDYFDGNTYVAEFTVEPIEVGLDPKVDVEPHAPTDIAFSEGARERVPVIEDLRQIARVVLMGVLLPASEMFPEGAGVPPP